ncbi:MAG: threonine ammonia-lyase, biosynthetic [Pseudomonadota bacterium]
MPQHYLQRALRAQVYDVARRTPLDPAPRLSERIGVALLLKREDLQPTFSFKLRGAYNCIHQLDDAARARGVVAASAGNHAQGVALAARELGVAARIFMPRTTPDIKVQAVAALGAEIVQTGDDFDAACAAAIADAEANGARFIHPFDDEDVIAGQGTIGVEITQQLPEPPDVVFVCVGGGGMAAGMAATIKAICPETKLIGVEPEDAASMKAAFEAGKPVDIGATGMFADGVAVRQVGQTTFDLCRALLDDVITVSVDEVCTAVRLVFEEVRAVPEPAGALAVAGAVAWAKVNPEAVRPDARWVSVVSGANVNFDRLGHVVERCALGDGTEALLAVTIPERAGSFLEFCRMLGQSSVTEFNYRHNGTPNARVFVGVRLREPASLLATHLEDAGYAVTDLTGNEVAKLHLRHLVGGGLPVESREVLYRFEFPERPGALLEFLTVLAGRWSISLFHYRNHGAAQGRVLAGFLVPAGDDEAFATFLTETGYVHVDESRNPAYREFLVSNRTADSEKRSLRA